jgi:hypothetical protein
MVSLNRGIDTNYDPTHDEKWQAVRRCGLDFMELDCGSIRGKRKMQTGGSKMKWMVIINQKRDLHRFPSDGDMIRKKCNHVTADKAQHIGIRELE